MRTINVIAVVLGIALLLSLIVTFGAEAALVLLVALLA